MLFRSPASAYGAGRPVSVSGTSAGRIYRHSLPFGEGGDPGKSDLTHMRRGRYGHVVDRTALFSYVRMVSELFLSNKCYVNRFVNS